MLDISPVNTILDASLGDLVEISVQGERRKTNGRTMRNLLPEILHEFDRFSSLAMKNAADSRRVLGSLNED